jgi:hypothetical protein
MLLSIAPTMKRNYALSRTPTAAGRVTPFIVVNTRCAQAALLEVTPITAPASAWLYV